MKKVSQLENVTQAQDGRKQVHLADKMRTGLIVRDSRPADNKGNLYRRVVQKCFLKQTVVAHQVAVIGNKNDICFSPEIQRLQFVHNLADILINHIQGGIDTPAIVIYIGD